MLMELIAIGSVVSAFVCVLRGNAGETDCSGCEFVNGKPQRCQNKVDKDSVLSLCKKCNAKTKTSSPFRDP